MVSENAQAEELMRSIEREEEDAPSTYQARHRPPRAAGAGGAVRHVTHPPAAAQESAQPPMQLCSVNLVIGTLYCSKGNFEFGISRVITSLKPYNRKLDSDTWRVRLRSGRSSLRRLHRASKSARLLPPPVPCTSLRQALLQALLAGDGGAVRQTHVVSACLSLASASRARLMCLTRAPARRREQLSDKTYAEVMDFLAEVDRWGKDIPARAGGNALDQRVSTEARLLRRMFMRLREPS